MIMNRVVHEKLLISDKSCLFFYDIITFGKSLNISFRRDIVSLELKIVSKKYGNNINNPQTQLGKDCSETLSETIKIEICKKVLRLNIGTIT